LAAPAELVELFFEDLFDEDELSRLPNIDDLVETPWLERLHFPHNELEARVRLAVAAAAAAVLDRDLGEFLDRSGLLSPGDERLLIVLGLAGDLLIHHPLVERGMPPLVNEAIHLPLWIRTSNAASRGTRRAGLVAPRDVMSTLAARAGTTGPAAVDRAALVCREGLTRDGGRAEVFTSSGSSIRSLRTPHEHAVLKSAGTADEVPSREEGCLYLFDKPDDVWDLLDISQQRPDDAEALRVRLTNASIGVASRG
jgi:hypothetical protein